MNGTSAVLEAVFLVPTVVVGSHTHTHARSRTHTQKRRSWLSQMEKLEAWLLHRGCLAFDS